MIKAQRTKEFKKSTKYLITLVGVLILVFAYFILTALGGTTIGQTLTTNPDLENGLVGHWTFDGNDTSFTPNSATVTDRSGNGNNGLMRIAVEETAVDTAAAVQGNRFNNTSSQLVWISDSEGFVIYSDAGGNNDVVIASTTDSGATWGNVQKVDSINNDSFRMALWYDRWTPGDTTGTKIHIVTIESGVDDSYYTEYDTVTNVMATTVLTGTEVGSLAASTNFMSITKAEDGDLYVTVEDSSDSWVHTCSTTCTSAVNWSAITDPYVISPSVNGNDFPILLPLAGTDNIMLISWDTSNDIDVNIYSATSTSWWGWNEIEGSAPENTTYDGGMMGATINKSTGKIYLVYLDDANEFTVEDHDIKSWEYDNSTFTWTQKTNVITDASGGLQTAKIAVDENTGDLYVVYVRRTTITDVTTGNIYFKVSTDNGSTWSAESSALNGTADQIYGATINIMSDERIGVFWHYDTAPNADDVYYATVVDLPSSDNVINPVPGRLGQALEFDGSDDYINVGAASLIDTTQDFTFSAWIKKYSDGAKKGIIEDGTSSEALFRIAATDQLNFYSNNDATNSSASILAADGWTHVAVTYNQTDVILYINGLQDGLETKTTTNSNAGSITIGEANDDYLDGLIDDVRIYNRALSAAEIQRIYDLGATTKIAKTLKTNPDLEDGLVGHWTFDGKMMYSNVADSSGQGNTGYLTNFTSTTTGPGKIGQALEFDDASSQSVDIDTAVVNDFPFTMCAWFNSNDDTVDQTMAFVGVSTDGDNYFALRAAGARAGDPVTLLARIAGSNDFLDTSTGFTTNTWHHACAVITSATDRTVFIDGGSDVTSTVSRAFPAADRTSIGRSGDSSPSRYMSGKIDDVRIYNRALSTAEIGRLYGLGATTKIAKTIKTNPDLETGLIGHWTFDGPNLLQNVADSSGQGNTGYMKEFTATSTAVTEGVIGQAMKFDGVDDWITVSSRNNLDSTDFSASLWVKPNATTDAALLLNNVKVTDNWNGWAMAMDTGVSGCDPGEICVFLSNATGYEYIQYVYDFPIGEWTNWIATFDSATLNLTMYINGVKAYNQTATKVPSFTDAITHLGRYDGSTLWLDGALDDVRIYNYTLATSTVERIYDLGR